MTLEDRLEQGDPPEYLDVIDVELFSLTTSDSVGAAWRAPAYFTYCGGRRRRELTYMRRDLGDGERYWRSDVLKALLYRD